MGITVIEQSTAERQQETEELFKQVKPLLDEGICLTTAIQKVKGIQHKGFLGYRWYKDLRDYAVTQGYQKRR